MKKWRDVLVSPKTTIFETMKIIDRASSQIALVVDSNNKLLGTVTDGDIRRGILKDISLEESISVIMNTNPITAKDEDLNYNVKNFFHKYRLRRLPIVNKDNQVVNLLLSECYNEQLSSDNWVVIMAGGLGTRLRPLTENTPKPMLNVGAKPIIETILESFIDFGFRKFYISVNYNKDIIKNYFKDGMKWGVDINYLDEDKRLGTAGALSLFNKQSNKPIVIINGDILTKMNYQQLLDYHMETGAVATMCVREYRYQVPYGVVYTDGQQLLSLEEKPVHEYFVNSGIYVLNPEVLKYIPRNQYFDMPSLFNILLNNGGKVSVFPIREYWLDIGRLSDLEKANIEYNLYFKG